jgi:broad specificity phosphatase PhoE
MQRVRVPFACLAIVLMSGGSAALLAADAQTAAQQVPHATIVLVRHAERSTGEGDDPLSMPGQLRSQVLAQLLRDADIRRIIASDRVRTRQTAEPLAKQKNLTVEVIPADRLEAVIDAVRQVKEGVVVVVHHSNTVPALVEKLGGKTTPIADDEFDRLLVITPRDDGPPTVLTLRYGAWSAQ